MELNKIQSSGLWGKAADDLNQNFSKVNNAVEQVKNATTRNKGYFSSDTELKSAFPSANVGDIAYVGSAYPYQTWAWDGSAWKKKNEAGGEESVNLGDYYTKVETDEKLDELGSYSTIYPLAGEGDDYVQKRIHLVAGRIYRIDVINPNFDRKSVTNGKRIFAIYHNNADGDTIYDYSVSKTGTEIVEPYYIVNAVESLNNNRYSILVRADKDVEVNCRVQDITDVEYKTPILVTSGNLEVIDSKTISFKSLQISTVSGGYRSVQSIGGGESKTFVFNQEETGLVLVLDKNDEFVFRKSATLIELTDIVLLAYQPSVDRFSYGHLLPLVNELVFGNQINSLNMRLLDTPFIGVGNSNASKYVRLIPGNKYRIDVVNPSFSRTSIPIDSTVFSISHTVNGDTTYDAVELVQSDGSSMIQPSYIFTAVECDNDNRYRISVKADTDEEVYVRLEDVTDVQELDKKIGYKSELRITGNDQFIYITNVGDVIDLTPRSSVYGYNYILADVSEGDKVIINGQGSATLKSKLWAFLDKDNVLISCSNTGELVNDLTIVAPKGATKVVINDKSNSVSYLAKKDSMFGFVSQISNFTMTIPMEYGNMHSQGYITDTYSSTFSRRRSAMMYRTEPSPKLSFDIVNLPAEPISFALFTYTDNFEFIESFKIYRKTEVQLEENVRYFKVWLSFGEESYYNNNIYCVVSSDKRIEEVYNFQIRQPSERFVYHLYDDIVNCGRIILPPNYECDGKPVPLAVYCHPSHVFLDWSYEIGLGDKGTSSLNRLQYLSNSGYAILDVHGFTSKYYNELNETTGNTFLTPICVDAYRHGIKYALSRYNIDKNSIHLFCASLGGQMCAYFAENPFDGLRSISMLCPSLDLLQRPFLGYALPNRKILAQEWGLIGDVESFTTELFTNISEKGREFIELNKEILSRFNVGWHYIGTQLDDKLAESLDNSGGDATICEYHNFDKFRQVWCPVKIWGASDDTQTPLAKQKEYISQINNFVGGGFIREMPEGTGGHHSTGGPEATLLESGVTSLGIEYVDIPLAWVEMLEFMNKNK